MGTIARGNAQIISSGHQEDRMTEENRRLDDKFALRLPKWVKQEIAEQAITNNRSTNAEMVARLERTIAEDKTATDARSKLAAQRVLSANLTGRPDPVEERFQAL